MSSSEDDVDLSIGSLEGFSAKNTTKLAMIAAFGKSNARSKPVKTLVASLRGTAKTYASAVLKVDPPAQRAVMKKAPTRAVAKKAVKTTPARVASSPQMRADIKRLKNWGKKVG